MLIIDELAYGSKLFKTAPKAKLVFGAVPLALCLYFGSFGVSITTILVMSFITVKFGGIPLRKYARLLGIPFGFLILGTLTIIFTRCDNAAAIASIRLFGHIYGITPESLFFGANIILKAFGAISCMYFISLNTPMNDILCVLRLLRMPAVIISLMELIYRYIFVFLEEAHRMKTAQDSRLGYANFRTGINSAGQLIGTLFLRAYLRTDRIYDALCSRGYEGEFKTVTQDYAPSNHMYAWCVPLAILLAGIGLIERFVIERGLS